MYSTWFSVAPRGYCDRSFLGGCASGLYRLGPDSDECWDERPVDGVLDLELGFEVRSVSVTCGWGDREGRELWDICDGEREDEGEARRVARWPLCPFE